VPAARSFATERGLSSEADAELPGGPERSAAPTPSAVVRPRTGPRAHNSFPAAPKRPSPSSNPIALAGNGGGTLENRRIFDHLGIGDDNRKVRSLSLPDGPTGIKTCRFDDANTRFPELQESARRAEDIPEPIPMKIRFPISDSVSRLLGVALVLCLSLGAREAPRPNVVLIITDDAGYADFGCYGATDIRTPNIDRLARDGVRLTDFYASPQCTPTRAALISGRYPQRVRLERALGSTGASLGMGLPATGRSLPRLLKEHGYATGLVGKWHLGYQPRFSANTHGFDYFWGHLSGYIDFYHHNRADGTPDLFENGRPTTADGYMTDLITERATRFIAKHAAAPFYLQVTYNAPHWPFQPPGRPSKAERNGAYQSPSDTPPATREDYAAMLECADAGVGRILSTLADLGLTENTLVIFTNDNGGEWLSHNTPFFHRKGTLWEGGVRVPAIFRWPARLPAGVVSSQPGITMDLTATILTATATPIPAEARLDGVDLLPILAGRSPAVERTLFWRFGGPLNRQQRSVRQGDWKLLNDGGQVLLFNLRDDPGERDDLAARRPEVAARLHPLITAWEKEVDGEADALLGPIPGSPPAR